MNRPVIAQIPERDGLDDLRTQLAIKEKIVARVLVEITALTAKISRLKNQA